MKMDRDRFDHLYGLALKARAECQAIGEQVLAVQDQLRDANRELRRFEEEVAPQSAGHFGLSSARGREVQWVEGRRAELQSKVAELNSRYRRLTETTTGPDARATAAIMLVQHCANYLRAQGVAVPDYETIRRL